jgi:hypothetical protein
MWNRNNPIAYSDPSGYCVEDACIVEGGAAAVGGLSALGWGAGAVGLSGLPGWAYAKRDRITRTLRDGVSAIRRAIGNSLPRFGMPGTTVTRPDGKQVREYGPSGGAVKDIDYGHDHGAGDPRAHDWKPDLDGNPVRQKGRPLTPKEKGEHEKDSSGS